MISACVQLENRAVQAAWACPERLELQEYLANRANQDREARLEQPVLMASPALMGLLAL